jgi:hypothetical protein
MRLRDYLRGYPLVMQSRLRGDEVQRRINAAAVSGFSPFECGVAGWARFGRIRLRYRQGFIDYGGSPILAGRISDELGPTQLILRYRAPLPAYLSFFIRYAFLLLVAVGFLSLGISPGDGPSLEAFVIGVILFLLLAPIVMHFVFTRHADAHFETIIKFLEEVAEARVLPGQSRPAS